MKPKLRKFGYRKYFDFYISDFACTPANISKLLNDFPSKDLIVILEYKSNLSVDAIITEREDISVIKSSQVGEDSSVIMLITKECLINIIQAFSIYEIEGVFIADVYDNMRVKELINKIYFEANDLIKKELSIITMYINPLEYETIISFNRNKFDIKTQADKIRSIISKSE